MKGIAKSIIASMCSFIMLALLVVVVKAQSFLTSSLSQGTAPLDTGGETTQWLTFTTSSFNVRYPSDWKAQALPERVAGTHIVEFSPQASAGRVEASIQVFETWWPANTDWEQEPELMFWREHCLRYSCVMEQVPIRGQAGWQMSAQGLIHAGDLARAVFVMQDERLYRFRLYLYQSETIDPYVQIFDLMLGTLQPIEEAIKPTGATLPAQAVSQVAPITPATLTVNYQRSLAYAYAAAWWNKENNSDNCYLWEDKTTHALDCEKNANDQGVDGAHFVNRAIWTGGRPIPQLIPAQPYDVVEAIRVSALRSWLVITDGWTVVSAAQAQVGDVAIIGNQCWAGLLNFVKLMSHPSMLPRQL